jgi:hypothetical protein
VADAQVGLAGVVERLAGRLVLVVGVEGDQIDVAARLLAQSGIGARSQLHAVTNPLDDLHDVVVDGLPYWRPTCTKGSSSPLGRRPGDAARRRRRLPISPDV